jgi:Ferritin-like
VPAGEILDQLDELASIEHSLCVEYLSIHCALGHDLEPADDGASAQHVAQAAQAASNAAFSEMRHIRVVNRALVKAGRSPQLARASSIRLESGSEVALGPLDSQQLERLPEREREIASAVDDRYARLRRAVESPTPVFEGELLSEMTSLLSPGPDHSGLASALTEELHGIPPSEYLRALPRQPGDELEQRLLDLNDNCYRLVVGNVQIWFEHEDEVFTARGQAIDTMNALNMINRLVVERGLLPAFPPP